MEMEISRWIHSLVSGVVTIVAAIVGFIGGYLYERRKTRRKRGA